MGLLSWLTQNKTIPETINAVGDLYTTDKARIEAESKLQTAMEKPIVSQIENNQLMTKATSLFSSLWQPLIGWSAGFLILIYWLPQIIIASYVWGKVCIASGVMTPYPIKPDDIMNLVYLLFGFGGYSLIKKKIT